MVDGQVAHLWDAALCRVVAGFGFFFADIIAVAKLAAQTVYIAVARDIAAFDGHAARPLGVTLVTGVALCIVIT